ncbi:cupin domain-containing protein [Phenylobacterium sp.]|jgi:quercetin dioxygenase-like cupin family protein|uniref:cupin domain-containing protein n=1 Tax=Phenylobacterium sp. TaxID=1871053 RepID=UPI002F3E5F31
MLKAIALASGLVALASPVFAHAAGGEAWGPGPPGLPPGSQATVVSGDPTKPGPFVIKAKMPAGYRIPPHWHPTDENVTLLSGDLTLGMGDKLDPAKGEKLAAGGAIVAKAKMHHFAMTKDGAVVQIAAEGPFEITYIDPADDPRRK